MLHHSYIFMLYSNDIFNALFISRRLADSSKEALYLQPKLYVAHQISLQHAIGCNRPGQGSDVLRSGTRPGTRALPLMFLFSSRKMHGRTMFAFTENRDTREQTSSKKRARGLWPSSTAAAAVVASSYGLFCVSSGLASSFFFVLALRYRRGDRF